jgi:DNA-binding GntR family transcriptional regulator
VTIHPTQRRRPRRPLQADIVRDGLRRAVLAGEFPPRSNLPNETLLGARFAVSRATIREAVRGLVEEGYLIRRQGSGTYVTERPLLRNSLDVNFSYTAYLESLGVRATRRVLGVSRGPAGKVVAERLHIASADPVVQVRRVRTADDRPAIYSVDILPRDIAGEAGDDVFGGSLYSYLAGIGHPVAHGEAILAPAAADEVLSTVLDVAPGTLLLHVEQVDVDVNGRRVMLSREWHVPSVIELRCFRRGPGASAAHEVQLKGE